MTLTYSEIFYRNIISSYQAHMIYRIIGKRLDPIDISNCIQ